MIIIYLLIFLLIFNIFFQISIITSMMKENEPLAHGGGAGRADLPLGPSGAWNPDPNPNLKPLTCPPNHGGEKPESRSGPRTRSRPILYSFVPSFPRSFVRSFVRLFSRCRPWSRPLSTKNSPRAMFVLMKNSPVLFSVAGPGAGRS